jgi:hypothetical protein
VMASVVSVGQTPQGPTPSTTGRFSSPALCPSAQALNRPPTTRVVTIDASTGLDSDAVSPSKVVPSQFKNGETVVFWLKNINPFRERCTLKAEATEIAEPAIATLLSTIGGVAASAAGKSATSNADSTKTQLLQLREVMRNDTAKSCVQTYESGPHAKVDQIRKLVAGTAAVLTEQTSSFNQDGDDSNNKVAALQQATACTDIVSLADDVVSVIPPQFETVVDPQDSNSHYSIPDAISRITEQSRDLVAELGEVSISSCSDDAAKAGLRDILAKDRADLVAFAYGSSEHSAVVEEFASIYSALQKVQASISSNSNTVITVLSGHTPLFQTVEITEKQSTVTVSASCTAVGHKNADPNAAKANATPHEAPTSSNGVPSNTSNGGVNAIYQREFQFGNGQRFYIAGGLVVSLLAQRQYTTVPDPSAPSTATAKNLIEVKDMSRTRILPLLALHGRWLDKEEGAWKLVPSYLSAGITAKSDDKGTSVEYLIGPSWPIVGRQFFFTVGAYAGQQQRVLLPSLSQDVSYTDSTLPIAKEYHWNLGFGFTWSPGAKDKSSGSASKTKSPSKP